MAARGYSATGTAVTEDVSSDPVETDLSDGELTFVTSNVDVTVTA